MHKFSIIVCLALIVGGCKQSPVSGGDDNTSVKINKMFNNYWEDRMKLYPLEATTNGDNRYNDLLPNDGSREYLAQTHSFYTRYLDSINTFDREKLSENDKISYDVFKREMQMNLDGYKYHTEYMPLQQFWSMHLTMPQLGSGEGNQPFKTVQDYDNFLSRIKSFNVWADTAIANMRTGVAKGYVLPQKLTIKVIPQLETIVTSDVTKNIFYGPINHFPKDFSEADKKRLTEAYTKAIKEDIIPTYQKLATFMKNEYLPKSRTSTGIDAIPNGKDYYNYLIRYWTTTNKTPDEIFTLGEQEVARLRTEMENIKDETGYKGDLKSFFTYVSTDKKFMPFKTPKEVIDAFWAIKAKEDPMLKKLFNHVPKTKFEIRQTEAFRAASSSAEYSQGSSDGSRPGIFYTPILDATKFNYTGMETLFLHEAIPGHHYQISLQQENDSLPKFRRFSWYGAYGEGWALYAESLGKELGLFTDPYQYLGHLTDAIHRCIRLVVDVGMHTKGWSREKAIQYMVDNERITEPEAIAEIERYMAIPGQALSYKIGQLKIRELRTRYENSMGEKFNVAEFHNQVLKDGCLPLDVFEQKMEAWAASLK
ncbi:DUF885 domain-containing protein [Solitalea koreensis]|uniref:Uncharacterized conserved protein, DUF885 familyt n=1 Tax=Solitalea koreensis TaxID=543615 RepID=A0A521B2D9_9SPHI|nr:DUF885 domain-containing protein [Solitalea koreensis]SMO40940.1 Uncharacterized conserved protein, DUF885 familyt [Solitalea koreensis]